MKVIIGIISFIIGALVADFIRRKEVKTLKERENQIKSKSAEKLQYAYEKIEQLTRDNKSLYKLLNTKK